MSLFGFGKKPPEEALADKETYRRLALKMVFPKLNPLDVGPSRGNIEHADRMLRATRELRDTLLPKIEDKLLKEQVEGWITFYEKNAVEWTMKRKAWDADMTAYEERRRIEEEQVRDLADKLHIRI